MLALISMKIKLDSLRSLRCDEKIICQPCRASSSSFSHLSVALMTRTINNRDMHELFQSFFLSPNPPRWERATTTMRKKKDCKALLSARSARFIAKFSPELFCGEGKVIKRALETIMKCLWSSSWLTVGAHDGAKTMAAKNSSKLRQWK